MNRMIVTVLSVLLTAGLLLTSCAREQPDMESIMQTQPPATEPPVTTESSKTQPAVTEAPEERFVLTFAGDCTLGCMASQVNNGYGFVKVVGEDYGYPFRNVVSCFETDDFTFLNLEGVFCDTGYPRSKKYTFRGSPSYVSILTESSVEAVTLANNHTMDFGQEGYDATTAALQEAGMPYVERDGALLVTTESGLTIGVYAIAFTLDQEAMEAAFASLRGQGAELIVFAAHWGTEYSDSPGLEQQRMAYAAIDAGADIVYGSHPHVLQPIEEYGGGIIYYSLGNFSFGGNAYPEDYDTALLQQEIIRDADGNVTLGELTIVPASVSSISGRNNYQPTPYAEGTEEYDRVMAKLEGSR